MDSNTINSIEEYISEIKRIQKERNCKLFVYRGEKKDFGATSCVPNIFREAHYLSNSNFEKNIYNDMYSKGIVPKQTYLETAIDAQHGGFPSRLLDVTYNALVALYFATEFKEDEVIKEDPIVTILFIDEVYIPGSHNSEEIFDQLVAEKSVLKDLHICSFNHKLLDHMNKNERIRAQQGAFILFQGREYKKIPDIMYKKIKINSTDVRQIQKDLDQIFGLNISKIYPESHNQIEIIKNKNGYINSQNHSAYNEFEIALKMFKKINDNRQIEFIDFVQDLLNEYSGKLNISHERAILKELNIIEESLLAFRYDLDLSLKQIDKLSKQEEYLELKGIKVSDIIELYNGIVKEHLLVLNYGLSETNIKVTSEKSFLLKFKKPDGSLEYSTQ